MATQIDDVATVNRFLHGVKLAECYTPGSDAPTWLSNDIPYLCLEVLAGPGDALQAIRRSGSLQMFVSGLADVEAVLAFAPEPEFEADLRAVVAAKNERALRDVLLAFPPDQLGFFYVAGDPVLRAMSDVLEGQVMPAREGYYATRETLVPNRTHLARKLTEGDYPVLQEHWSEDVWQELLDLGYGVFACQAGGELQAFCFHWRVAPGRREVHGLQGVRDYSAAYAESVVSAATEDVLNDNNVATCTALLSNAADYRQVFERVGYRRFYRVDSFLGGKRGSVQFVSPSLGVFYRGRAADRSSASRLGQGRAATKTDPVVRLYRELEQRQGRLERSRFMAEGIMLVQRALDDGLPVDTLVYTTDLLRTTEGLMLLEYARRLGVDHYRASGGLMGTLTSTRPLPSVIAIVHAGLRRATELWTSPDASVLVTENLQNPNNLGMVLRTADAAGVEAVVVSGGNSDPLHKNCVRAARGAVGRIPIFLCDDLAGWLQEARGQGLHVLGTNPRAKTSVFQLPLRSPLAVVVGNEQTGVTRPVLAVCTEQIKIPMAPGQESLNVGVATGVLLYEVMRKRLNNS